MKNIFYFLLFSCCFISGCRKEKTVEYSGRLLFTQKIPSPLAIRKLEIYQPGSSSAIGMNSGSTSSVATTVSDGSGYYHMSFKPGRSSFIIFSGTNSNNLYFQNTDSSFPGFTRRNYPGPDYDENAPTYVGKVIDTALIKVSLATPLIASDTIGLRTQTTSGKLYKEYTGLSGAGGSVIVIDTIYNMLFTDFDCNDKMFFNDLHAGRKTVTASGNVFINSQGLPWPYRLSADDQGWAEITFYFK